MESEEQIVTKAIKAAWRSCGAQKIRQSTLYDEEARALAEAAIAAVNQCRGINQ